MAEPALLECPFCGRTPDLMQWSVGYQVRCITEACNVNPSTRVLSSRSVVIANWNQRGVRTSRAPLESADNSRGNPS